MCHSLLLFVLKIFKENSSGWYCFSNKLFKKTCAKSNCFNKRHCWLRPVPIQNVNTDCMYLDYLTRELPTPYHFYVPVPTDRQCAPVRQTFCGQGSRSSDQTSFCGFVGMYRWYEWDMNTEIYSVHILSNVSKSSPMRNRSPPQNLAPLGSFSFPISTLPRAGDAVTIIAWHPITSCYISRIEQLPQHNGHCSPSLPPNDPSLSWCCSCEECS